MIKRESIDPNQMEIFSHLSQPAHRALNRRGAITHAMRKVPDPLPTILDFWGVHPLALGRGKRGVPNQSKRAETMGGPQLGKANRPRPPEPLVAPYSLEDN